MLPPREIDGAAFDERGRRRIAADAGPIAGVEVIPAGLRTVVRFDGMRSVELAISPIDVHQPTIERIDGAAGVRRTGRAAAMTGYGHGCGTQIRLTTIETDGLDLHGRTGITGDEERRRSRRYIVHLRTLHGP